MMSRVSFIILLALLSESASVNVSGGLADDKGTEVAFTSRGSTLEGRWLWSR